MDKWLWAARFFKTRNAAAVAVSGGKVHLEAQRVKPAKLVKAGHTLQIRRGDTEVEVVVRGVAKQRRPAPEAILLYEETPRSIERRLAGAEQKKRGSLERTVESGRPSKRDRRQLTRLKGK